MKPGKLDLPTIWRGCVYPPVQVDWTDGQGNPIDVSGWHPRAYSRDFQFAVEVRDARNGITALSLPSTSDLKLGATNWDFIWNSKVTPFTMSQPFLKGSVEVKEPVTDPRTPVMGRTGGGSNYAKMFLRDVQPDIFISIIGRYHQTFAPSDQSSVPIAPLARSQMAQMVANGQTKITILCGFVHSYLDYDPAVDLEYVKKGTAFMVPFNPDGNLPHGDFNVRLTDQQQLNLSNLLNDIRSAGFKQVNFRFQVQSYANNYNWPEISDPEDENANPHYWIQERYRHNKNYILSIIPIVEANKGDLNIIYDIGLEHGNNRLVDTDTPAHNVARQYCRFLWAAYLIDYSEHSSMAFSIVGNFNPGHPYPGKTPIGLGAMLDLFKHNNPQLPYPGYYGMDLYGRKGVPGNNDIHDMMVDGYDYLKANYHGEDTKPFIIQETYYNDGASLLQIERALGERNGFNLHSVFQWPTLRGHDPPNYIFPDGYPFDFTAYKTL